MTLAVRGVEIQTSVTPLPGTIYPRALVELPWILRPLVLSWSRSFVGWASAVPPREELLSGVVTLGLGVSAFPW